MKASAPAENSPTLAEPNRRPMPPPAASAMPRSARSKPVAAPRMTSPTMASAPAMIRIQFVELFTSALLPARMAPCARRLRRANPGHKGIRKLTVEALDRAPGGGTDVQEQAVAAVARLEDGLVGGADQPVLVVVARRAGG